MWVSLPDSFVSIVKDKDSKNPDALVVRARQKAHLTAFFGKEADNVPDPDFHKRIVVDFKGERDYRYRVRSKRDEVAKIMFDSVMNMTYTNFKAEAKKRDPKLAGMYSMWWQDHFAIQK